MPSLWRESQSSDIKKEEGDFKVSEHQYAAEPFPPKGTETVLGGSWGDKSFSNSRLKGDRALRQSSDAVKVRRYRGASEIKQGMRT